MENEIRDKFANEYAVANYTGDEYNVDDFKKGWDCCEKEMIAAVEQLKAENKLLKDKLEYWRCTPCEFIQEANKNLNADISALKSKLKIAVEALVLLESFGYITQFKYIKQALTEIGGEI